MSQRRITGPPVAGGDELYWVEDSSGGYHVEDVDLADLAAAYLFGFAQKQGFVDGNKRTAVATMLVFLSINATPLHVPGPELYRIAMAVTNSEVEEAEVAEWIRRNLPD